MFDLEDGCNNILLRNVGIWLQQLYTVGVRTVTYKHLAEETEKAEARHLPRQKPGNKTDFGTS
jgi:hypothetical protein